MAHVWTVNNHGPTAGYLANCSCGWGRWRDTPVEAEAAALEHARRNQLDDAEALTRRAPWCRIHGQPGHLHRAVCSACFTPLGPGMVPTCRHAAVGDYVRWQCWERLN